MKSNLKELNNNQYIIIIIFIIFYSFKIFIRFVASSNNDFKEIKKSSYATKRLIYYYK